MLWLKIYPFYLLIEGLIKIQINSTFSLCTNINSFQGTHAVVLGRRKYLVQENGCGNQKFL